MESNLRREQLLSCAIRVTARNGLGASGHAATAAEAGVSIPTVFAYFPTRQALITAVVKDVERFYEAMARECLYRSASLPDRLMGFLGETAKGVRDDPDRSRIWLAWSASIGQPDLWKLYLKFHRRAVNRLTEQIKQAQKGGEVPEDVNASDAALILVSSSHTTAQLMLTHQPFSSTVRFHEELVKATLHLYRFSEAPGKEVVKKQRAPAKEAVKKQRAPAKEVVGKQRASAKATRPSVLTQAPTSSK